MKARLIILIVASACVVAAVHVASASASTLTTYRQPGSSYFQKTAAWIDVGEAVLNSGYMEAERSPNSFGTGTQYITFTWRVWKTYNGNWSLDGKGSTTIAVAPGRKAYTYGWEHRGLPAYYSTDLRITWKTSTGYVLGESFRDLVEDGDYQCNTSFGCAISWIGGQSALLLY